jgi:HEAT repeat protein
VLGLVTALLLAGGGYLTGWVRSTHESTTFHGDGIEQDSAMRAARCHEDPKGATRELLAIARSSKEEPRARYRAIKALGWLQQPEAVAPLLELATSTPGYADDVIEALRFFGERSDRGVSFTGGGRPAVVVFPAAPSPAATQALLQLAASDPKLTRSALQALQLHKPSVAALMAVPHADQFAKEIFPILRDDGSDEAHAAMVKLLAAQTEVRPQLAEELGYSGRADAVAPLYALLGSASAQLRLAALGALLHLAGKEFTSPDAPDPEKARALAQALFGSKLDRFDAKVALKRAAPVRTEPEPTSCSPQ